MRRPLMLAALCALAATLPAFAQEDGQVYRIKSKMTDKLLVPDADGTKLVQGTVKPKETSGHWKLVKAENGTHFMIVNVGSGKVITSPSKDSQAEITLEEPGKGDKPKPGQLWSVEKRDKMFLIESKRGGLYLDVVSADKADGAKIIQYELNEKGGRGNQLWDLIPVEKK